MYKIKMRRFITLFVLLFVILAASASDPKEKETVKPIELTKATFLEKVFNYEANPEAWKYNGDKPAIIDFYATWCGPCRITSPILADLAAEYGKEIYVYKIDVDKEPEQSIPMFLFIPMNEQPQVAMGALPRKSFKEAIDTFLLKKDNQTNL
jgi:thiol-disulfide isomerase/thioredoxin